MIHSAIAPLATFISALESWDQSWKIHPILVDFTAALVPVSVGSDWIGRLFRIDSLRQTAWWTMLYAGIITPFTAIFGWLFWMGDDNGHWNMTVHKWLGSGLAVVILCLMIWRITYRKDRRPGFGYLLFALLVVGALTFQGVLGGNQTFSGM